MILLAYAQNFISYLLSTLSPEDTSKIKEIILFGSAARGEAAKESDIDIFVDVFRDEKQLEKKIIKSVDDFYKSIFFEKYWKLLDIKNEIKPIIGKLDAWKDLKSSIIANGIVLYGKYVAEIKGENFAFISWGKVKPESKRVWLSKTLYGYKYRKKKYIGILETHGGQKISSNCIMLPVESYSVVARKFKQAKISIKTFNVSVL